MPRLVVPGYPHHVTQRGNRRMKTFFCDEDYRLDLSLLSEFKEELGVAVWAYCLMPNHVH
jgi:putative transposase